MTPNFIVAEAARDTRDAVEDLVERAVAAADEQVIDAIVDGAGRCGRGVAFADRHHDLHHPHPLAQEAIDGLESVRSRVCARSGIDDEPGFQRRLAGRTQSHG